ncbi:hypothetical protein [Gottfriedia solisilvae]|uniref:hypothetical protein n=1 Tax=Gottfriedia solisilvae TaxID=1516104 RepID=UPI003D2F01ED
MSTKPNLILVEGLPGFGKSTTARLVYNILKEQNVEAELFLEGDVNHPADFEGVAFFTKSEMEQLFLKHELQSEMIKQHMEEYESGFLIPYQKLHHNLGLKLSPELLDSLMKKDIYELPLEQNQYLIEKRWQAFAEQAKKSDKVTIFECCFIQNPITVGMIKYNASKEKVSQYIKSLENAIEALNPLLLYVSQDNLKFSFHKAINERPKEWFDGFVNYYVNQAFGSEHDFNGLEGTIKILEARKQLEVNILEELSLKKEAVNNSNYDLESYQSTLENLIRIYF